MRKNKFNNFRLMKNFAHNLYFYTIRILKISLMAFSVMLNNWYFIYDTTIRF